MELGDLGGHAFPDTDGWLRFVALQVEGSARRLSGTDPRWRSWLDRWSTLPADRWCRELTSPHVVGSVYEAEPLAHREDPDGALIGSGATQLLLRRRPDTAELRWLRAHGPGSKGSSSERACFLDPTSTEYDEARLGLEQGLGLLERTAPGFAADVSAFIQQVALVDGLASFRGATGLAHFGMAFYSPDGTWNPAVWAEELVHEASHLILESVSFSERIVINEDAFEEKYDAPFRPDPRHLYGNMHALFVLARLFHLFARLRATPWEGEVAERAVDYLRRSEPILNAVIRDAELSMTGSHVMSTFIVPSFEAAAREFRYDD